MQSFLHFLFILREFVAMERNETLDILPSRPTTELTGQCRKQVLVFLACVLPAHSRCLGVQSNET
ncbi:hypothetical protein ANANG_G00318150 [Anguilla anguilla]|uniref:Uncharacterized protein n=1 Tax=Anguilla anguilla TaxID=7936 RepID=A0A9D3RHN4_ANGAN|nr:hypothetical protein ANANG_G00318150 [Anguilla anguilla]